MLFSPTCPNIYAKRIYTKEEPVMKNTLQTILALALVLAMLAGIAGCGGDGDDLSTAAEPETGVTSEEGLTEDATEETQDTTTPAEEEPSTPAEEEPTTPAESDASSEEEAAEDTTEGPAEVTTIAGEYEGPIINVHEHMQSFSEAAKFLAVMDETGTSKTVLLGSSWFTFTLNPDVGYTRYDWNNEELMRIVEEYPGRFEAFPTVNPEDPDKLEKFKALVERGASGLKLYLGHGFINPDTGDYFFHTMALDDPRMLPLYEYCEENCIPILFHVNPGPTKPGFADEFIAVLDMFPDLKVNCPHFMLSSIKDTRLRELLDTYPNLYTDISFGHDDYLKAGLLRISRDPDKFRDLFTQYPDRIMYGTDMVVTAASKKTTEWIYDRCQVYIDMLAEETYTTPLLPGEELRGLALPEELLQRVFYQNYVDFMAKKPVGTEITREINWDMMGVEPCDREPGVALPPPAE